MTKRILLLGDSIIDNGVYVQPGEPDVSRQLQSLLPALIVERRAVDGSVTADVLRTQAANISQSDLVISSSGGNDALGNIAVLDKDFATNSRAVLVGAWEIREQFRNGYATLLDKLRSSSSNVLTLTIYNPAFQSTGMERADQQAAEAALSLYNDVIQQEARVRGIDVLELRNIFTEAADYANPIEPSAQGGAKLAAAMAKWVTGKV